MQELKYPSFKKSRGKSLYIILPNILIGFLLQNKDHDSRTLYNPSFMILYEKTELWLINYLWLCFYLNQSKYLVEDWYVKGV